MCYDFFLLVVDIVLQQYGTGIFVCASNSHKTAAKNRTTREKGARGEYMENCADRLSVVISDWDDGEHNFIFRPVWYRTSSAFLVQNVYVVIYGNDLSAEATNPQSARYRDTLIFVTGTGDGTDIGVSRLQWRYLMRSVSYQSLRKSRYEKKEKQTN